MTWLTAGDEQVTGDLLRQVERRLGAPLPHGDAAVVGWQSERVVDAINGKISGFNDPTTGSPRSAPDYTVKRFNC